MSDYHEMWESWTEGMGYDPAYVGEEEEDHSNKPVDPDAWADDAFDGGC